MEKIKVFKKKYSIFEQKFNAKKDVNNKVKNDDKAKISFKELLYDNMHNEHVSEDFVNKNMDERFVSKGVECFKNSTSSKHCEEQLSQVKTETDKDQLLSKIIAEKEEALNKLNECFKDFKSDFKTFDFKKFAEVNGITVDAECIPHSDNVKNSFRRMYAIVDGLLNDGTTLIPNKENGEIISVKLTAEEVDNARTKANEDNEICQNGENSVAYRLYVELYNIICDKLHDAIRNVLNAKNALCEKDVPNNTKSKEQGQSITGLLKNIKQHCNNIQSSLKAAGNDPQIGSVKCDVKYIIDFADEAIKFCEISKNANGGINFTGKIEKCINEIAGTFGFDAKGEDSKFFADLEAKLGFIDKRFEEVKTRRSFITGEGEFVFGCFGKSDFILLKSFLTLPFMNAKNCIGLCRMFFELIENAYSYLTWFRLPQDSKDSNKGNFFKDFQKLGMLADGTSEDFKKELLCAAKTLTKVGMSVPLCAIECVFDSSYDGLANIFAGVALRNNKGLKTTFYHECVHNVRSSVGACVLPMPVDMIKRFKIFQSFNVDESIHGKNLKLILSDDLSEEIEYVLGDYALANCEEFLAELGSEVLSLLEQNKNPFDYISDERLWRLYYEFGGPDFAPIIQQKGFLPAGYAKDCDILSDKKCDWCSGYPSKFGIDINQIKDQQVEVEGMTAIGQRSFVKIDEKTILPPPPLGYCYTTENGRLQLKIDKSIDVLKGSTDNKLYDPVFCSLTDGPLTLMHAEDRSDPSKSKLLQHHFEVLKK